MKEATATALPGRLRLGTFDFVNILPVMHGLPGVMDEQPAVHADLVSGAPRRLVSMLAAGELDASPISALEYARGRDRYVLLPDLAVASRGAVGSVLLFSWLPLDNLDGEVVGLCSATVTSAALLGILMEDFYQARPVLQPHATVRDFLEGDLAALLLIGDEALTFRHKVAIGQVPYVYDLGALWWEATRLPMVFAVWAARADADGPALCALAECLRTSRDRGVLRPHDMIRVAAGRTGLDEAALDAYFGGLSYRLEGDARQGLLTFYQRAAQHGLCPACDDLRFMAACPAGVGGLP